MYHSLCSADKDIGGKKLKMFEYTVKYQDLRGNSVYLRTLTTLSLTNIERVALTINLLPNLLSAYLLYFKSILWLIFIFTQC